MLDNILNIIKEVVSGEVNNNTAIADDKKGLAIKTITNAIGQGLSDNAGDLGSLLSGKGNNALLGKLQGSVVDSLAKKIGLDSGVAHGLVSTILPAVLKALGDSNNGFSLESLTGAFAKENTKSEKGGILGTLGKLFG